MQATASVSYSCLLRYKFTEERCSLQLNVINKDLKTNVEVVTHLPADCLIWKCLAHLWAKLGIIKVDMQKRFILVSQLPLVSGELRTTEHRAGFVFCSLKEPEWDYRLGQGKAHRCGRRAKRGSSFFMCYFQQGFWHLKLRSHICL